MMRAGGIVQPPARRVAVADELAAARGARAAAEAAAAARRRARSLIVEFHGPPAAGKTTLALALGDALEREGMPVRVVTSTRPAERRAAGGRGPGGRLAAPFLRAAKLADAVRALAPGAAPARVAELVDLLRPEGRLRALRLRRYAIALDRAWQDAFDGDGIVIFDQGFLNLLCSLAISARATDRRRLARGLALVRAPDLAILLDAPHHVIEFRLSQRLGRQTALERLFENDLDTALLQAELSTVIHGILRERGGHEMRLSSLDHDGLSSAVDAIAREIRVCMECIAC